ncbi:glutathione S-transferase theta-2-like [Delphinus delphis]|uniref:glutathione S-transferase theta-2-like n=1 Tax=Delphinus delphis TaxID=9728 RepID=UPI0002BD155C|nr:glutathione S-transferase theta-2-like [Delphinus delphis]
MVLELFLDLYSPPCRAIYIFTRKNSIPFEMHPVELAQGEHLKPEFLKVNPLEKVPALRDGDFLVAESESSSEGWELDQGAALGLKLGASEWKGPVDAVQLQQLLGKLTRALQHPDQEVLAARPFLATEQVSLTDLMAFTELMQPTAVGCDLFQDWSWLAVWRARVEATLGLELVQEAHRC